MRRISMSCSALLLAVLFLGAGCQGASSQDAEEAIKKVRLNTLYKAYQAHEVFNRKPAQVVDDLPLGKEDVNEFKRWLNLDELGESLVDSKKEDLAKMVMVYEKEAPKDGGIVMFYDGSVKTLSAAEVKKLVGKEEKSSNDSNDEKQLVGTWTVTSEEDDGKASEKIKGATVIFEAGKLTVKLKGEEDEKSTYKLHSAKKPKAIDIDDKDKKATVGIYELDGNKLKLCIAYAGEKSRPTEFTTSRGSKRILLELRREKNWETVGGAPAETLPATDRPLCPTETME